MDDALLAKQAQQQLLIHEGEKIRARERLELIKKQQQVSFQQKLEAKQKKKEELQGGKSDVHKNVQRPANSQSSPPSGEVTFISITVKDVAMVWETIEHEEAEQLFNTINQAIENECKLLSCFLIWGKDGKFLVASQSLESGINLALRIQIKLNENEWPSFLDKIQSYKVVKSMNKADAKGEVVLFNGPRIKTGILSSQTTRSIDSSTGVVSYSGAGPIKAEAISNLAEGGQILVDAACFESADNSKVEPFASNQLGSFRLDGFSHGCKLTEILPLGLKERTKHFGQHCAHCGEPILPKEQFFKALGSVWHVDHFKCFSCDVNLEGSYLEYESMPYCKTCYLKETSSKCYACNQSTAGVYITALGQYWHPNCFCCKGCKGKAVDGVNVYQHESELYCEGCLRQLLEQQ